MSEAWSWANVLNADAQSRITKDDPNLSTCPKMPDAGQVDKSVSPLKGKHQHDLSGQNFQGIDDASRYLLMRLMVEWSERAAMMTCDDLTAAQAEMAAWHDLGLDSIFFGTKKYH